VVVSSATTKEVTSTNEFVGRSVANNRVELRARVTGFIESRPFQEGARVAKGDLLYLIEQDEYRAALDAAQAQVDRAQAEVIDAGKNLERSRVLADRQTVSQATLDEAIARDAQAGADLNGAKAALAQAQLNLGYTQIEAPLGGRISTSALDEGNLVGPESGVLATIVATDPIEVRIAVTEREVLAYRRDQANNAAATFTPRLKLVDGSYLEGEGTLSYLENEIDPTTGTASLYILFPNPQELVLPGQFVTVALETSVSEEKVVVPQSAVQSNQAGPFVLVVGADDKVEARPVGLGERQGAEVVIESGLEPGETIVVEGMQKVRPGAAVTPTQAGS
jgi:membrane fusion protein (multidrug efflux system)